MLDARRQVETPTATSQASQWTTLLVLCGALFLDTLDVSMMGVALPSIRREMDMATSSAQWIASAYALGFGGFLLLGGRAADLFGRRRMLLAALGAFVVASGLGGAATNGTLLIVARFVTGVAAAFTAPAALSIITTSFAEGPARTRALSIFSATGATGFSLGLVVGGLLTEGSWRLVFFVPVLMGLVTLVAARRLVPAPPSTGSGGPGASRAHRGFDVAGAATLTIAMLLLVFTVVEAPTAGWGSARTVGSVVGVGALLGLFVGIERRVAEPLVRLGILRSGSLVRANIGAMALLGGWLGTQFVSTLYMQQLRGWSAAETGLAIFPGGLLIVLLSPRFTPRLVARYGLTTVIAAGLAATAAGYALLLRIGLDTGYPTVMLPAYVLVGAGNALAYGPLAVAATNGIAPDEQGLAGGLVNTSFQFGGAVVVAVVTAVIDAVAGSSSGSGGNPAGLLDAYRAALLVPLAAALIGIAATLARPASSPP